MEMKVTEKRTTKRKTKEEHKKELREMDPAGMALKLQASKRPGYERRFVNDNPQRIALLKKLGYEFAKDSEDEICEKIEGDMLGANVGSTGQGEGRLGYLMEIPIERYEALRELRQEKNDEVERQMIAGQSHETPGDNRRVGNIEIGKKR